MFYIEKQKAYSSKMAEYSQAVDDITRHLSDIETDIIEINRLKSDYILRQSREHLNLISTHFSKAKNNIEAVVKEKDRKSVV